MFAGAWFWLFWENSQFYQSWRFHKHVLIFFVYFSHPSNFFTDICSFDMNDEFEKFLPLWNGLCLVFHRHVAGYGVKDVQGIAPTFEFEEPSRLAGSSQERNDDRSFQNKCTEKYYPETVFLFQCFHISLWINLWVLFFGVQKSDHLRPVAKLLPYTRHLGLIHPHCPLQVGILLSRHFASRGNRPPNLYSPSWLHGRLASHSVFLKLAARVVGHPRCAPRVGRSEVPQEE